MPLEDVPVGADEADNVAHHLHGEKPVLDFEPKEHFEISGLQDSLDFETAAKLSGSRFVILKGQLAALERALGQFMINLHTTHHGYLEVSPPLLVRDDPLFGTGAAAEILRGSVQDHRRALADPDRRSAADQSGARGNSR